MSVPPEFTTVENHNAATTAWDLSPVQDTSLVVIKNVNRKNDGWKKQDSTKLNNFRFDEQEPVTRSVRTPGGVRTTMNVP